VVSFAQYDNVRREGEHNEVEMLMPVVAEVFGNIGITKDDVGFICSGSTDYLVGGPFSFVTRSTPSACGRRGPSPRRDGRGLGALRGLGAPAGGRDRRRPRLLLRALVAGRPERDPGPPARPVLHGPAVARPHLAGRAAGAGHDRRRAGHRGRLRRRGQPGPALGPGNPKAQVAYDRSPEELLAEDYEVAPLRRTPCRR
jgi:hypothetical protein